VTKDLVHSAVLGLTRGIHGNLQESTINLVMLFYKALFSNQHLTEALSGGYTSMFHICSKTLNIKLHWKHWKRNINTL